MPLQEVWKVWKLFHTHKAASATIALQEPHAFGLHHQQGLGLQQQPSGLQQHLSGLQSHSSGLQSHNSGQQQQQQQPPTGLQQQHSGLQHAHAGLQLQQNGLSSHQSGLQQRHSGPGPLSGIQRQGSMTKFTNHSLQRSLSAQSSQPTPVTLVGPALHMMASKLCVLDLRHGLPVVCKAGVARMSFQKHCG